MIDWDDAFDNMGYVQGAADIPAKLAQEAAAFRSSWAETGTLTCDIPYGTGPRETLDLFSPQSPSAGLVVFVHGGYWRRFSKADWSHLAAGCLLRGWSVAMPSYPLAPDARISEITQAVRRAICCAAGQVGGPLRLIGHSAGGHLVSRMMCDGILPDPVITRVQRVISISGLHMLEPLLWIKMNTILGLTQEEAKSESPALLPPVPDIAYRAWVGTKERPEFLRQTRLIDELWDLAGAQTDAVFDPGHDHFSIIDALRQPESALVTDALR